MFFGTVLNYSVGKETSVKFKCQVQVSSSSAKFKCQVQEQREKSQEPRHRFRVTTYCVLPTFGRFDCAQHDISDQVIGLLPTANCYCLLQTDF